MKIENKLKKEIRGFFYHRFDESNKLFAFAWIDNNNFRMLPNHQGGRPHQSVRRWSRQENKKNKCLHPSCIMSKDNYTSEVDKMNWLINKYRISIGRKKCGIFFFIWKHN